MAFDKHPRLIHHNKLPDFFAVPRFEVLEGVTFR
jgi:hypothetical protein